jgi:hypothetical protein
VQARGTEVVEDQMCKGAAEAVQGLSRGIGAVGLTWLTGPHIWPGMPLSG